MFVALCIFGGGLQCNYQVVYAIFYHLLSITQCSVSKIYVLNGASAVFKDKAFIYLIPQVSCGWK